MTKQPYPEEFKIEAVKQITERGHRVSAPPKGRLFSCWREVGVLRGSQLGATLQAMRRCAATRCAATT